MPYLVFERSLLAVGERGELFPYLVEVDEVLVGVEVLGAVEADAAVADVRRGRVHGGVRLERAELHELHPALVTLETLHESVVGVAVFFTVKEAMYLVSNCA